MPIRFAAIALALGAFVATASLAQPAVMVKDVSTVQADITPYSAFKVEVNGQLFFLGSDGVHGWELWKTDGSPAGTAMVKDLCPGACAGLFNVGMVGWNGKVYFVGNDSASGSALFVSDGTAAGTLLVKDIVPGRSRGVDSLFAASDRLFLVVTTPEARTEVWTSQGTEASTQLLLPIDPAAQQGASNFMEFGGGVLFFADDGTHGAELWKTDGTPFGTSMLAELVPGPEGVGLNSQWTITEVFQGSRSATVGGALVFLTSGNGGTKLWTTDGTALGTTQIWSTTWSVRNLVKWGAHVYMVSQDGLWRTDGTVSGTALVVPGSFSRLHALAAGLVMYGSTGSGSEPYFSDGTPGGTVQILDLNPGPAGSNSWHGFPFVSSSDGTFAIFWAVDVDHGEALWRTDGSAAGTLLVSDRPPGPTSASIWFGVNDQPGRFGSQLLFLSRRDAASTAAGLFTTDGLTATLVHEMNSQTSLLPFFWTYLPGLRSGWPTGTPQGTYFVGGTADANEIWFSEGSEPTTRSVVTGDPGVYWFPIDQRIGNRSLLMSRTGLSADDRLWSSENGSAPELLAPGNVSWPQIPRSTVLSGERAYFALDSDLWRTDGRAAGTELVEAGAGIPVAQSGNTVFLTRTDAPGQQSLRRRREGELSETLGTFSPYWTALSSFAGHDMFFIPRELSLELREVTGSSTTLVSNLPTPRPYWSIDPHSTPFGVFFVTADATGSELWMTDGTAAGTHRVADIFPGPLSSEPEFFVSTTAALFFAADDGVHGRELWTSDGTEAGTRMVKDIVPGPGSGLPDQLYVADGLVVFSATDGVHGRELWVSNGTEAGTLQVQDIAPGAASSTPQQFTIGKDQLFFLANDTVHGFELWRLARTDLAAVASAPGALFTLTPCRLYDSRSGGGPLTGGGQRSLAAHGACGVPEGARSVAVNVTAVEPSATGSLFLGANDGIQPLLEFPLVTGRTRATQALLHLSTTGDGTLRATANFPGVGSAGSVDWVLDIVGYFE